MDTKEIVKSWKWRIVKAGLNVGDFSEQIGVARSAMSEYLNGKKSPSLERFDRIENKLRDMGV